MASRSERRGRGIVGLLGARRDRVGLLHVHHHESARDDAVGGDLAEHPGDHLLRVRADHVHELGQLAHEIRFTPQGRLEDGASPVRFDALGSGAASAHT